jgi:hypothetical protein
MTNLEHYRSSREYREILRILQKSTTLQDNILWQSHPHGKHIIPVQFLEIDFIAREVLINFDEDQYQIDPSLPLYIKLGYRMTVFKIVQFRQNQNALNFSFPELVKTQESRNFPRHTFSPAQDKFVILKSSLTGHFHELGSELKVRVMDVSEKGLGLIVSEQNRNFIKHNRVLWISDLHENVLEEPIVAEVAYMNAEVDSKFQVKKQRSLKVGLSLSVSFPEHVYNRFLC